MKKTKMSLSIILSVLMLLSCVVAVGASLRGRPEKMSPALDVPPEVYTYLSTGEAVPCGYDSYYQIVSDDWWEGSSTVFIFGIGDMQDYAPLVYNEDPTYEEGEETEAEPTWEYDPEYGYVDTVYVCDGIRSIGAYAFGAWDDGVCIGRKVEAVIIPESVISVGEGAFADCDSIANVYYEGSEADWNAIDFAAGNDNLLDATVTCGWSPVYYSPICQGFCGIDGAHYDLGIDGDGYGEGYMGPYWMFRADYSLTIIAPGEMSFDRDEQQYCYPEDDESVPYQDEDDDADDGAPWSFYGPYVRKIVVEEGVLSICGDAFTDCASALTVSLPRSLTSIGENAFAACTGLTDVYYAGTEAEWDSIAIAEGNDPLLSSAVIHFTDHEEEPTGEGPTGVDPDAGTIDIKAKLDPEANKVLATIYLDGCEGLESAKFYLTYDAEQLAYSGRSNGADYRLAADTEGGAVDLELNYNDPGLVEISFYFKNTLDERYYADAAEPVDVGRFELITIEFDVLDPDGYAFLETEPVFCRPISLAGDTESVRLAFPTLRPQLSYDWTDTYNGDDFGEGGEWLSYCTGGTLNIYADDGLAFATDIELTLENPNDELSLGTFTSCLPGAEISYLDGVATLVWHSDDPLGDVAESYDRRYRILSCLAGADNADVEELPLTATMVTLEGEAYFMLPDPLLIGNHTLEPPVDQFALADVNNDGRLNNRDFWYFARYIWDYLDAIESEYHVDFEPDLNQDGKINNRDSWYFAHYIWDYLDGIEGEHPITFIPV